MMDNWGMNLQLREVKRLQQELLHEADQRRLARDIQQNFAKRQRPRRLAVLLALLGMQ